MFCRCSGTLQCCVVRCQVLYLYCLQELEIFDRTSVGEFVPNMLFHSIVCLVQSPHSHISIAVNLLTFFLNIVLSQCIKVSRFSSTLDIFFSGQWKHILARTKMIKATHSFKYCIPVRTKSIQTKAVNFLLSVGCIKTFNFTVRSLSLKERHDHLFKTTCFVLSRCESTGFWKQILACVQFRRHRFAHWVWVKLTRINSNYGLANNL